MKYPHISFKKFFHLILFVSCCLSASVWSQDPHNGIKPNDGISQRMETLKEEASDIASKISSVDEQKTHLSTQLNELALRTIEQTEVERARLDVDTQNTTLKSIKLDILTSVQQKESLTTSIKSLKSSLQTFSTSQPGETIDIELSQTKVLLVEKEKLLELELKRTEVLHAHKQLISNSLALKEQWLAALQKTYQNQQEQVRESNFVEIEKLLNEERTAWQEKAKKYSNTLNQYKNSPSSPSSPSKLEHADAMLLQAEDSIFLIDTRLKTAKMQVKLEELSNRKIGITPDANELKSILEELKRLATQAKSLIELLTLKEHLLTQRIEVVSKELSLETAAEGRKEYQQAESIYKQIHALITHQLSQISSVNQNVQTQSKEFDILYVKQKKRGLTARHQLPHSLDEWQSLLVELSTLPEKTLKVVRETLLGLWTKLKKAEVGKLLLLIFWGLIWSFLCLSLGRLPRIQQPQHHEDFFQRVLFIASDMLYSNRFSLLLGGLIISSAWLLDIFSPGLIVIGSIFVIWISARIIISFSRWLLKSLLGLSEKQPGLHRLIVYFVLFMSLSNFILLLGGLDLITPSLMDLVERVVMLLLLPPAYLTLRIRKLLIEKISEKKESGYWSRLIGLISLIIPAAIFTAALVGIAGYINLAWAVAGYLLVFIAVISIWLVARGLVMYLAKSAKNKLIQNSERAIFWTKSIVEPLELLVRLGLFLVAAWLLYRFFGGDPETGFNLKGWFQHTLFTFGETPISSLNLLGSILLFALIFYLGRWSREVTYGWLYANIHDLGIRNSLSVFTQYTVVVIGLLVALNILGINLTSLAVFAGALGVGIGFGLQNIANNFVSGLILLAERPIRTKDWVTIGDKEGEVAEIGMRSVTVTTWDNQDVIIPNSDLTSTAFINWTRTNNVVRTVLIIGIRYQDDPHKAKTVIEEAVIMQPEVSLEKKPLIVLTEFAASSVNFRVQYYMDVMEFSRLQVKSKVMFAIWDALKEAGIGIPFPQQDIYIKELPTADSQFFTDFKHK